MNICDVDTTHDFDYYSCIHDNTKMASGTPIPWSDHWGKTFYGAVGNRDVLIIVSEDPLDHLDVYLPVERPDVVERRPAIQLTEEVRRKLEHQGILREEQCDDLTIVKARYGLHKETTLYGVKSCKEKVSVCKEIASLMNNTGGEGGKQTQH